MSSFGLEIAWCKIFLVLFDDELSVSEGLDCPEVNNTVTAEEICLIVELILFTGETGLEFHTKGVSDDHDWRDKDANEGFLPAEIEANDYTSKKTERSFSNGPNTSC